MIQDYFRKMKGTTQSPPRVKMAEIAWSSLGGLLGICLVAYANDAWLEGTERVLLIGSFGASAVLIFGTVKSPLAQPSNLLCGHIISALIGVTAYKLLPAHSWLASGLAVATAIAAMHATKTLHPPGGATALIAVIGGKKSIILATHMQSCPSEPERSSCSSWPCCSTTFRQTGSIPNSGSDRTVQFAFEWTPSDDGNQRHHPRQAKAYQRRR
jgi:hypothetical protein